MGIEVEHASGDIQTATTTPSSTIPTSGPKISMFAKKSGFVIPKNKLSGSLVPIYRGTKKGDTDLANEEATSQVLQRKTKWVPDLTQDTIVRKGRALAYQTRIDQISQQLTLGTLGLEGGEDSLSTSDHQLSKEESEWLELEKREIIGEVLKLNPAFKAPADYKPLLKETKIPVPIKEYPGYNFIGLIFGPANDTQKRLEKETGAKIQVYGTKSETGGKVEIIRTFEKETNNAYEDLYVQVSADTFEKIDAAVALIELFLTPVSANTVSSSTTSTSVSDNMDTHQNPSGPIISPAPINQQTTQPYPESLLPPQGQLPQYPQQWFSPNLTHIPPFFPTTPSNSSSPLLSNTVHVSSSPFNPTATMPSLFGPRPIIATSFHPVLQNPHVFPPRPQNAMQPPYMQQAPPMGQTGGPRNTPGPSLSRPSYNVSPVLSTSTPPIVTSHGHNNAMNPQNTAVSLAPPMNIPNNVTGPPFGPSQSESARPTIQTSSVGPARPAMPQPIHPGGPPMPLFQSSTQNSIFWGSQNFDIAKPISGSISRPQQPRFSDFTFQPRSRPLNADIQVWQSTQPAHHNVRHPLRAGPGPQPPMLRPATGNMNPSAVQSFPMLQINQLRAQIPANFTGSPTGPIMPTSSHMQRRNFIPTQAINNSSGPFPRKPGRHMQIPENHLHPQQRFLSPHQQFGNYPGRPFSSSSGGQQVYDPFSPTSVPFNGQMGDKARVHGETDPEYEDLMASVGVQ